MLSQVSVSKCQYYCDEGLPFCEERNFVWMDVETGLLFAESKIVLLQVREGCPGLSGEQGASFCQVVGRLQGVTW